MQKAHTLVQITDPHLHARPEGTLLGMNTENSLKLIVDRVQQEVKDIDLIIATGDIAQDSSIQAYNNFLSFLAPLKAPMRWIPGNNDSRENIAVACTPVTTIAVKIWPSPVPDLITQSLLLTWVIG